MMDFHFYLYRYFFIMKIVYIDAQNIHKSIQDLWRIIDRKLFFIYLKRKFDIFSAKIFFGYIEKYKSFYAQLRLSWYEVVFKETLMLPDWTIKGNVDIDIAIHMLLDMLEWNLQKAYLVTGDGDYNTLVTLLLQREKLWRVIIPHRDKASKLLKKAAWPHIQSLSEIQYFIEKKKSPDTQSMQDSS